MEVTYHPIGILHTPFRDLRDMPIQPTGRASAPGTAEIFAEYAEGLRDLDGFSHVILLYHLHQVLRAELRVVPFLGSEPRGVFATRAPSRPNPIGLSIVSLLRIEGCTLHLGNVDILDGTPLLDVKPYVPAFDRPERARAGWLEATQGNVGEALSDDRFK
jgi:tRNA-Thr(GGU) m(6)t(6)A37 methyltransferase TsaA